HLSTTGGSDGTVCSNRTLTCRDSAPFRVTSARICWTTDCLARSQRRASASDRSGPAAIRATPVPDRAQRANSIASTRERAAGTNKCSSFLTRVLGYFTQEKILKTRLLLPRALFGLSIPAFATAIGPTPQGVYTVDLGDTKNGHDVIDTVLVEF